MSLTLVVNHRNLGDDLVTLCLEHLELAKSYFQTFALYFSSLLHSDSELFKPPATQIIAFGLKCLTGYVFGSLSVSTVKCNT